MLYTRNFFLIGILSLFLLGCNNQKEDKEDITEETIDEDIISNEDLLNRIQEQTINYFWEGAEPNSGLARERIHMDNIYLDSPENTVTTGGSGFGVMAILVGVERGFISREDALLRFKKIVDFLDKADRFHGAWPHWINGETGKVYPFSE